MFIWTATYLLLKSKPKLSLWQGCWLATRLMSCFLGGVSSLNGNWAFGLEFAATTLVVGLTLSLLIVGLVPFGRQLVAWWQRRKANRPPKVERDQPSGLGTWILARGQQFDNWLSAKDYAKATPPAEQPTEETAQQQ